MYKVFLTYQIYSRQKGDPLNEAGPDGITPGPWAWAQKNIELPFVPFIGLRLESPNETATQSITAVTWVKNTDGEEFFKCHLESQYPHADLDYQFLKMFAVELKFLVREVGADQRVSAWTESLFTNGPGSRG